MRVLVLHRWQTAAEPYQRRSPAIGCSPRHACNKDYGLASASENVGPKGNKKRRPLLRGAINSERRSAQGRRVDFLNCSTPWLQARKSRAAAGRDPVSATASATIVSNTSASSSHCSASGHRAAAISSATSYNSAATINAAAVIAAATILVSRIAGAGIVTAAAIVTAAYHCAASNHRSTSIGDPSADCTASINCSAANCSTANCPTAVAAASSSPYLQEVGL
jgi:hypothetical protein